MAEDDIVGVDTSEFERDVDAQVTRLSQAVFWSFAVTQGEPQKTEDMGKFFALNGLGVGMDEEVLNLAKQNLVEMTAQRLNFELKPNWKEKFRNTTAKIGLGGVGAKVAPPDKPLDHLPMSQIVLEAADRSGAPRLSEREAFDKTMDQDWDKWIEGYRAGMAVDEAERNEKLKTVTMSLGDWLLEKDYQYLVESKKGRPGKADLQIEDFSDLRDQKDPWLSYVVRYVLEDNDLPGAAAQVTQKLREYNYVKTRLNDAKNPGRASAFYEQADGEAYIDKLYLVTSKYREKHPERFGTFIKSGSEAAQMAVQIKDTFGETTGRYYKQDPDGWYYKA